jgi:tetratricopeptide (TPR) repeat protein
MQTWYGVALKGLKRYEEAITVFKRVLDVDRDHYPAEAALAEAYLDSEQYDLAVRECRTILKKYHKNRGVFIDGLQIMGNAFGRQGKYILAEVAYKHILMLDPNNEYAGLNYLYSLHKQGVYSKGMLDSYEENPKFLLKIWHMENTLFNNTI